ncbi:MAG: hypothetical protein LBF90_04440 [Prevotellaceae bacterium]|nr:hypothetical protein [Prevotellaceae bacterium]
MSIAVCSMAFSSCGSPAANDLSFLKNYDKQYPADARLWEKQPFIDRLKQAVGDTVFASLQSLRGTEVPIEVNGDEVIIAACEQHNCSNSNILIVVDLAANTLAVGVRKEGAVTVYNAGQTASPVLQKWQATAE